MTAWIFPYFPKLGSPNELTRLYLARAIVDDGTFSIDAQVRRWGRLTDMAIFEGKLYCDKAPGTSFLAVPLYAVLKWVMGGRVEDVSNRLLLRILRITLVGLSTSLIAILLFSLLGLCGLRQDLQLWLTWAYGLATIGFSYGCLLYGHQLCAMFVFGAFYLINTSVGSSSDRKKSIDHKISDASCARMKWRMKDFSWHDFFIGLCLSMALLVEYTSLLAVLPLLVLAVVVRRNFLAVVVGFLGFLGPMLLLAIYHWNCFGAPWLTGYGTLAHQHYARVHSSGFMGLVTPQFRRLMLILFGSTRGLFFFSPWLLLGLVGTFYPGFRRSENRNNRLVIATITILYFLFGMSLKLDAWGWSLGPRHLVPLIPFLVMGVAYFFSGKKYNAWVMISFFALVLYSLFCVILPTVVFGGFPPFFSNPIGDFIWPLFLLGCLSPSVGSGLGLSPLWGAMPFFIALFIVVGMLMIRNLSLTWWQRVFCIGLAAVLVSFVLLSTGPPDAKERKTLSWAKTDILQCE